MFLFILRRILAAIPVMAMVALFVFSLLDLAPGDPAAIIAGDQASHADVERIRASLGLDRPYLVRFAEWSFRVVQGDLGSRCSESPKRDRCSIVLPPNHDWVR